MGQRGEVLLISCYELGHQPLAIASPLGFLERAGYSPDILDLSIEGFDTNKVSSATFIGISVPMHTALRLGIRVAERIRKINPTSHICFYGLYASLNSEYLLEHIADSVIGGEFEKPLVALIEALAAAEIKIGTRSGRTSLQIEGVSFRGQTNAPFLKRFPFVVPNNRLLPPLQKYAQIECDGARRLAGYVEASRGCLHHCLHCPIPPVYGGRFFVVPKEVVLEGIRRLVEAGATHITFGDPDFLNGPRHSLQIVRAMHEEFPDLTFDFTAKVEHLIKHRAVLSEFAKAGCLFVVSAFESLSNTVLANLKKEHSREDIYAVLKIFRDVGITLRPTWVPFTPWAAIDDYIDFLEFISSEQLVYNVDPVQYTIRLLIPPRSALLNQPTIKNYLGSLDQANFSYHWTHPDPCMDELQARVNAAIEQMLQAKEDTVAIFNLVRKLAYAVRGSKAPPLFSLIDPKVKSPRLTEPWFC